MKINLLILLVAVSIQLHAQPIQGVVLDANTQRPIPNASVYINNTTIGTSSDAEGVFSLQGFPTPPYNLVVSAIGYETHISEITEIMEGRTIAILLKPRVFELPEFVVQIPVRDGWRRYGNRFFEAIIGYSNFAGQCRIVNPEVLSFFYDSNISELRVYAEEPLIIMNNALGYRVTYWLTHFVLNRGFLSYQGTVQFEDLITDRTRRRVARRWQENRFSAYNGSIQHFITALYHNRTAEEGFEVIQERQMVDVIAEVLSHRDRSIPPPTQEELDALCFDTINPYTLVQVTPDGKKIFAFQNELQIIYKNEVPDLAYVIRHGRTSFTDENTLRIERNVLTVQGPQRSSIFLLGVDQITISPNGNFEPLNGILQEGYWAFEKLDKLVPLDYKKVE